MTLLPLAPPIKTMQGDCWKCGEPLNQHPVYEGTCYPVCGVKITPPDRSALIAFRYRRPWHRLGWCGNFVDERGGGIGVSLSYDVWRPTRAWAEAATRKLAGE